MFRQTPFRHANARHSAVAFMLMLSVLGVAPGILRAHPTSQKIAVSGRALDSVGRPVSGAEVFLVSVGQMGTLIAKATSDAHGEYRFTTADIPIQEHPQDGSPQSVFQVFGRARGFGFTWTRQRWLIPQPRPAVAPKPAGKLNPERLVKHYTGEAIKIDLSFPAAAQLSGRIVDEKDQSLAGMELTIWGAESLTDPQGTWKNGFSAVNYFGPVIPTEMKSIRTDKSGEFAFRDLPVDCRFRISVRGTGFPVHEVWAATTAKPQPIQDGWPQVLTGELRLKYHRPIDVPVRVLYSDTRQPAPQVKVSIVGEEVEATGVTDSAGRATLRIAPGKYESYLLPVTGTAYRALPGFVDPRPQFVTIPEKKPQQPLQFLLPAGVLVDVTVVDAETGAGIPHVDVWQYEDRKGVFDETGIRVPDCMSWNPETKRRITGSPLTDQAGKLQAAFPEGKYRFGVGHRHLPAGYEAVEKAGQLVQCEVGKRVSLKFKLRKQGK